MSQLLNGGKCSKLAVDDNATCDCHGQIVKRHMPLLLNMTDLVLSMDANVAFGICILNSQEILGWFTTVCIK